MPEPLILLPGMLCDARLFTPQLVALSREMAVTVAPVTLGERIEEIASEVLSAAPARFALAGHAMGGVVALEVLRRAPERVTRLALLCATPLAGTPQEAVWREDHIIAAKSGRFDDVITGEMRPDYLASGPGRADTMAKFTAMARALGPKIYIRQVGALLRRKDQQATLRKIRQPTLVLCGEQDNLVPVKRHEFMAELIPAAQLVVVAGAGHLPTLEAPQVVTDALRNWLKQPLVLR
jgi:pimeloyl-ACP methyl ester carboxylesterase